MRTPTAAWWSLPLERVRRPAPIDQALVDALASSQRLGMLGDRPIARGHRARRRVRRRAAPTSPARSSTSGSGGGVPGLVIARARPDLRLVLVDRRATRADHLAPARRCGSELGDRVEVVAVDARALPTSFGDRPTPSWPGASVPRRRRCAAAAPLLAPAAWSSSASRRRPDRRPLAGRRCSTRLRLRRGARRRTTGWPCSADVDVSRETRRSARFTGRRCST